VTHPCVFCRIVCGDAPADVVQRWDDATAFVPLNPVTPGHLLVIPNEHVQDAIQDPAVTAQAMYRAAGLAHRHAPCNLITSVGGLATQTIYHLHIHIVPRRHRDGLKLPWTEEEKNR
jgi:histidine triad (HIT) family protein